MENTKNGGTCCGSSHEITYICISSTSGAAAADLARPCVAFAEVSRPSEVCKLVAGAPAAARRVAASALPGSASARAHCRCAINRSICVVIDADSRSNVCHLRRTLTRSPHRLACNDDGAPLVTVIAHPAARVPVYDGVQ
ncbi:hypothetical protein EVAR_83224_1 [Eumeta japonica]|uniref:Uncharacterized protein n=1 Tax=Eumeta variegata TaxID=151549 RepID=A0A4C1Y1W9_EUMVA|nr:hypothetical protein EVAR_83224_1 [Eumeta japonica]